MKKIRIKVFIIYFCFLILSFFTIFIIPFLQSKTYYSKQELVKVECGWPFSFVIQSQSHWDPLFPLKRGCVANPLENGFKIIWSKFLLDLIFVLGVYIVFFKFIKKIKII